MEHFGTRLKRFREDRNWSQEQLGFELEVTKATISKWESGRVQPRLENLGPLRKLMTEGGLSLDWLIHGATAADSTMIAPKSTTGTTQSRDEAVLLAHFRAMTRAKRKALLELITPARR